MDQETRERLCALALELHDVLNDLVAGIECGLPAAGVDLTQRLEGVQDAIHELAHR